MKLTLILTFITIYGLAQDRIVGEDPNVLLDSLNPKHIRAICVCSKSQGVYLYTQLKYFTEFEQLVLKLEGYREADVITMMKEDPRKPFEIIRKAWDEKWSKVYCPLDSNGSDGYVDVLLLSSNQFQTIRNLYSDKWHIKANINRIVNIDPFEPAKDNPHTLADLIEKMLAEKWGQIAYRQSLAKDIESTFKQLREYGARRYSELTDDEKAHQLKFAEQLPKGK